MQTDIDGITKAQAKRPSGTYEQGYAAGYAYGVREGLRTFGASLDMTSIIIPTYDRIDLLMQCLDHIEQHTTSPYEIIVVDNGSADGTAAAVRRRAGGSGWRCIRGTWGLPAP
ncbi:hypothetical protein HMSSN139_16280 [Paenibacillus sp. HMSSN-139]|nr:hypothetical protein HMSSN139_16280 [Paenibacillus sp. HMSSN-139]